MDNYTFIEFLVEDKSGKILIEEVMKKYKGGREEISYHINGFKGIGAIPKNTSKIKDIKSGNLLNNLPMYLRGISKSLESMQGRKAIFVILDNDANNCAELKKSLTDLYKTLNLAIQVFFCIAIEEMEAWLLGDKKALFQAYPNAKPQLVNNYKPDSIIGTWEYLADVLYHGGLSKLKKDAGESYYVIGKEKCKWAEEIGIHMDIRNNDSPSFRYFISKLDIVCE